MNKLLTQNAKLKKDNIFSWGLPAVKSCPFAGVCKQYCYADKGFYLMPSVKTGKQRRLELSKTDKFVPKMIAEIKKRKVKHLRIHDSGDFYSLEYLKKWIEIIEACPEVIFYAYTKSIILVRKLGILPSNFKAIFSIGGIHDHLIDVNFDRHSKIFETKEQLESEGYIDASKSDLNAIKNNHKVGLVLH